MPNLVADKYESIGVRILAKALKQPIRVLIENKTGLEAPPIIEKIDNSPGMFIGFDVHN